MVARSLLHYCTFRLEAANDAQNVRVDTSRRKDNYQQNISKMIIWYHSVLIKSLQMSQEIPIPVIFFISS